MTIGLSCLAFSRFRICNPGDLQAAARKMFLSAFPATLGIVSTVGLAQIMEHTGMMQLVAQGLSEAAGRLFPLLSPLVGMLGTFATSSNTNSNVLFVSLQKQVASLISILPIVLVASQTAGGSLGSLIAPAKLMVGCSNVGLAGREGEVLRRTLPYGLGFALMIGILTLLISLSIAPAG
jgi:lactate permease